MVITEPGQITPHLHFLGSSTLCFYYIHGKTESILVDAGVTISAVSLAQQLHVLLVGPQQLTAIWLTHSHYDHLGSVPYLLQQFPGVQVGAHPVVKDVLANPKAIEHIHRLLTESERRHPEIQLPPVAQFAAFAIQQELQDNELVELGDGVRIRVLYTPGHTRDSLSFYILPDRALCGSDGLGVPSPTGFIQATFLSNYFDYLDSLHKMQQLDIELLCLPHGGVIQGKEAVQEHFRRSLTETMALRQRIEHYLKIYNGDSQRVTKQICDEDYQAQQIIQPIAAFLINLRAMVERTKKDLTEDTN